MVRRSRSLVPLSLILAGMLIAFQTAPVPTQTTAPSPTLYGVQGFGPAGAQSGAPMFRSSEAQSSGPYAAAARPSGRPCGGTEGFRELGILGGAKSAALGASYSIVVGQAQTASGRFHAFRTDLSMSVGTPQLVDLGTLGGSSSVAYATEHASTVGSAQVSGNMRWQAFIWTNGTMSALPVGSQGNSSANDILFDQIVGHTCDRATAHASGSG